MLNIMATAGLCRGEAVERLFSCLKTARVSSRQTVAGASQLKTMASLSLVDGVGKSRCLILAEGWRGSQEFN